MKKERLIIEVSHQDGEILMAESWFEGDLAYDKDDLAEQLEHESTVLACTLAHTIVAMTDNVKHAMFAAGQFTAGIVDQIEDEWAEKETWGEEEYE